MHFAYILLNNKYILFSVQKKKTSIYFLHLSFSTSYLTDIIVLFSFFDCTIFYLGKKEVQYVFTYNEFI